MTDSKAVSLENLDALVEKHLPFLIRTVSSVTGRYVSVAQDDEFSVALSAFAEAVERYEPERGNFLSFAGLVIQSRLKTYLQRENRRTDTVSLEELCENGRDFAAPETQEHRDLQEEIQLFQQELSLFGLTLEALAQGAPKHQDTRERAVSIAEQSSQKPELVRETYQKKKLPVRAVAKLCSTTEKTVKGSKHFILATMLVFFKKFPKLLHWVQSARCAHV